MIGFWVLVVILGLVLAFVAGAIGYTVFAKSTKKDAIAGILGLVFFGLTMLGGTWWLNNTASGLRTRITWQAEINVGLNRTIQVFTATGELVYEYEGRFDVTQNEYRIIIDVINEENQARRVYVSAPAGVVIISEILD
ncbi:MAG: hypothetical protein FWE07_05605 [Turicibacter sp.]|nr:hypothetical protein [Turicibacter sp.]